MLVFQIGVQATQVVPHTVVGKHQGRFDAVGGGTTVFDAILRLRHVHATNETGILLRLHRGPAIEEGFQEIHMII